MELAARPRRAREARHEQRRDALGRRRPPARARPHRRRARRAVGADQAQHLRRRSAPACVGVGGSVFKLAYTGAAPAARRPRHAPARPGVALDRRPRRPAERPSRAGALLRALADDRRGHVADPAQHRRRARARPAEGALSRGLRAHRRPGRAPGGDPRVLRRPLPARRRAQHRARRRRLDRDAVARARRDRRVLAARSPRPTAGSGSASSEAVARVRGARPRAGARPARRHATRRGVDPTAPRPVDVDRRARRAAATPVDRDRAPGRSSTRCSCSTPTACAVVDPDVDRRRRRRAAARPAHAGPPRRPVRCPTASWSAVPTPPSSCASRASCSPAALPARHRRRVPSSSRPSTRRSASSSARPIGSFQAVKHLVADMLVRAEVARARGVRGRVHARRPRATTIRRAPRPWRRSSPATPRSPTRKTCIQVHGGMGFTWEVDVHLYRKRAWVLDTHFGNSDEHAEAVAAML